MSEILTGPDRGPPKFDWRDKAVKLQAEVDRLNAAISDGAKQIDELKGALIEQTVRADEAELRHQSGKKRYPGCPVTEPGAKCATCEASCEGPWNEYEMRPARYCPKCGASGDKAGEAGSDCWANAGELERLVTELLENEAIHFEDGFVKLYRGYVRTQGPPRLVQKIVEAVLLHDLQEALTPAECTLVADRVAAALSQRGCVHQVSNEPRGTFACPHCGRETPHTHTQEEINAYAEIKRHPNLLCECFGGSDYCYHCGRDMCTGHLGFNTVCPSRLRDAKVTEPFCSLHRGTGAQRPTCPDCAALLHVACTKQEGA